MIYINKIIFFFKKIIYNFFFLTILFIIQLNCLAHSSKYIPILINQEISSENYPINIQSDKLEIFYPKKIQFSGHVSVQQHNNILITDKLIISHNIKDELSCNTTLHAIGNIYYKNNYMILTGNHAWINLYNKNINLHKGTYYLLEPNIHGTANIIMQREKNNYTILKQGKCTSCIAGDNYWNIIGSEIIYDHRKHNIDIWHACLKIKKIPIFYSPYLSWSLYQNHTPIKHLIPSIKYSSQHGLIFKTPYPINFSKHCSGSIAPIYMSDLGIKLETKIQYSITPGSGLLIFNIIGNDKIYNKPRLNNSHNFQQLYWKHNGIMNKKWYFNSYYVSNTHFNHYTNKSTLIHTNNNEYTNIKFVCRYSDKNYNTSLSYIGTIDNTKFATTQQNICNYSAAPKLELNIDHPKLKKIPLQLKLFNQITQFIPTNHYFPKTIRIHTEPILNFNINDYWGNLKTELKLKITHYQQNNIDYYNKIHHTEDHLKNTVNRIIPQFKINGKIIFKKKPHLSKKYTWFLEPRLQYLYIPYHFQKNIGIYDTSTIHINHNNLFHDSIYSGLDRIEPVNQITGDITIRCYNKKNELLCASIGPIFNWAQFNSKYIKTTKYTYKNPNFILFSGTSHWNINNNWHFNTEMQYNIQHHTLSFGTVILEHIGKNNQILQTNYRYFNTKYLEKKLLNTNTSIYHKTISQLGILICYPLLENWKISYSHYHNIKTNKRIDQTIGIQYYTPCWGIYMSYERKIINWNHQSNNHIYDNKIQLNIKIYNSIVDSKLNTYQQMLNIGMLPYQHTI